MCRISSRPVSMSRCYRRCTSISGLDGLQCVQSLSRLNRVATGKTDTLVLDFVNEPEQVQEAFQGYYQTTTLAEETDPNRLYDLQSQLDGFDLYDEETIDRILPYLLRIKSTG